MYDLFVYAEHPLGPQGRMVGLDGEALHRYEPKCLSSCRYDHSALAEYDGSCWVRK